MNVHQPIHIFVFRRYVLANQDIVENGIPTLDFVSSAKIGEHFTISLKAQNLLNSVHQLTRKGNATNEEVVLSKYRRGIDFSLGVACTF